MLARFLDLAALRSFIAVAETGGVTRAATRVNLTQSAVSMQLKRLEEAVGQSLFERSRKRMTLTSHGEQLLSYARRLLELNDEVWARMTDVEYEGEVVLGAPHDIVYPNVPIALRQFARAYPRVRFTLQSLYTHALKEAFAAGEIDVILTTETEPDRGSEVLSERPIVFVGAPGGVAWQARPLPLAFETHCIFRPWVQRALDDAGISWTMAVESMSIRTVQALASADFAVHAALDFTVPRELEVIAHGGALPELPRTKVALYVAEGPNAHLASKLAEVIRDVWVDRGDPPLGARPDTLPGRSREF